MPAQEFFPKNEKAMLELGASLAPQFQAGDVVFLSGELGAGKTTLVRGLLAGLNFQGPVRSPTFSLIQLYETDPKVAHVDLYRVKSHAGLGLEDLIADHLVLIEWPDRAAGLIDPSEVWRIEIEFAGDGRKVVLRGF